MIQSAACAYRFRVVSQNNEKEKLSRKVTQTLKKLYGNKARIDVVHEKDIAPEPSGKYLLSKALFPLNIENYLEESSTLKR